MQRYILLFLSIFIINIKAEELKIGLALSGGGAKGFAHIGVLKVFEEINLPIDYLSGVSMGSVIGGLYAIGYSAKEIEDIATLIDWESAFNDVAKREELIIEEKFYHEKYLAELPIIDWQLNLPTGLIKGQKISELLNRYTWFTHHESNFYNFKIPFSCVATNLIDGKAIRLNSGILSEAMRASMAIPTVFTPVVKGEYILGDGFLSRNLPAIDAKEMGADIVIGVDVGEEILSKKSFDSFMDVLNQTISYHGAYADIEQRKICDLIITPKLNELSSGSFSEVEELIKIGETAARNILPKLLELKDSLNRDLKQDSTNHIPLSDSVFISDILIAGNDKTSSHFIYDQSGIYSSGYYKINEIEDAVNRLFSTDNFKKVTYNVLKEDKKNILVYQIEEKNTDLFKFGFNFNSIDKTSFLLNTTVKNIFDTDSKLFLDLKLTSNWKFNLKYITPLRLFKFAGIKFNMLLSKDYLDYYTDEQIELRFNNYYDFYELYAGTFYSKVIDFGVGIRFENQHYDLKIGPPLAEEIEEGNFLNVYTSLYLDTFDKTNFPNSGTSLNLRAEFINSVVKTETIDRSKFRFIANMQSAIPIVMNSSLLFRFQSGFSTNSPNDLYHIFSLGGIDNFPVFGRGELIGTNYLNLHIGTQIEIFQKKFLSFKWNVGKVTNKFNNLFKSNNKTYVTGFLLTLGMESLLGPIELNFASDTKYKREFYFNFGYKF